MSLRTTQQIDKLIVGQIYPRDTNNAPISSGLILLTDSQGRAIWTTLSTVTSPYTQFTSVITPQGTITATTTNTAINIRDGGGMNLQIVSNALYLNPTTFSAVDISGGNSLLSSNGSNNTINPRLKFANGNNVKIRGDPGTNTVFFDIDYLSSSQGARATYTSFRIANNSSFSLPSPPQQVVLNANLSDTSFTMIGVDDLQITQPILNTETNTIYIGLSTITTAKFSTLSGTAYTQLSNLSTYIDIVNNRQINTAGLTAGQFYPLSVAFTTFSTSFSQNFISNQFNVVSNQVNTINSNFQNELNISTNILSGDLTVAGVATLNTVRANYISATFIGDGSQITNIPTAGLTNESFDPISTIAVYTSTTVSYNYSTLSSYIKNIPLTLPPNLSTNWLSTGLLTANYISATVVSTTYGFFSTISAGSIYAKFIGDGSSITNLSYAIAANLSANTLSSGLITTSSLSTQILTANFGQFSTISAGSIYSKFIGDGSFLTNISNTGAILTISNAFVSVSNSVNLLLTVNNISDITISTSYGFFSTISVGSIYGKHVGDGSALTNVAFSLPSVFSTNLLIVSSISTNTISTNYGFFSSISAGTIYGKHVGDGSALTNVPFKYSSPSNLSTTFLSTGYLTAYSISTTYAYICNLIIGSIESDAGNLNVFGTLSTGFITANNISTQSISTNYGFFSTISAGSIYGKYVGDGSALTNLPLSLPSILSANVVFVTSLSAQTISTTYGFFSTISVGSIYGKHVGDGSGLTNVPFNPNGTSIVPAVLSTTTLSTGLLTASSISTISFSANSGQFSSISSGQVQGKFIGDGSLLTNLPGTITTNQITTVSATGSEQTLVVPSGVTSVLVILNGAGGGASALGTAGGAGGLVSGIITTTPGETLTFIVGKAGTTGTNSTTVAGGYGGGGSTVSTQGGTGGGRTAVKKLVSAVLTEILTAGGGGGGGGTNEVGGNGGGPPSTFPGIAGGSAGIGDGKGGSSSAGGAGGTTNGGSSLQGGNTISGSGTYSGAGGGGYYGGGGGTNNPNSGGAGGGGGGFALASIQNILGASGGGASASADGSIIIYYNTVSIGADTVEANTGYFSTVIANTFIGKYLGDGSALTGIVPTNISVNTISSAYGFFSTISAGTIYAKFVGDGSGLTNVTGVGGGISIVPPNLSTTFLSTNLLTASTVSTNITFTNKLTSLYGNFSSISAGQAYISSLIIDSLTIGNDIGYTNMGDIIATSLSTILITTGYLFTPAISSYTLSTNYGFFSTISANIIYGKFVGDGSGLTNVPGGGGGGGGISIVPPILSTTLLSTNLLTASNISANVLSTNYGFFSTISANTIYAKFVGDASLLTSIPNNGSVLTVSNNVITVSNNLTTTNTSVNTVSNSVNTVSNSVNTVSNSVNTVSNSVNTVSSQTSFLLSVSNMSAVTTSTNYGFFSTLSAGTIIASQGIFSSITATQSYISSLTARNISTNSLSTNFAYLSNLTANGTTILSNLNMQNAPISNVSNVNGTNITLSGLSNVVLTAPIVNINNRVFTTNASSWTNGTINTLYGSEVLSSKYIQWSYNNNPGTLIADNNSIGLTAQTIYNTTSANFYVTATGSAELTASFFNFFSDCYFNNHNLYNLCNINFTTGGSISNVLNQYFQYGGSIQAQLGGTGGQQGILNISYPAAGTGHTNDGIIYIWGGRTSGDRYINLDSTNIGITVPLGAGNLWLNANTINAGSLNMYSNTICNVSNIIGSGELPITAATGCNINITGTYINLIANNVQFSSNFGMNSGTTASVYSLNVQTGLNMYSNNITNVSNINFATGGSISNASAISTNTLGAGTGYITTLTAGSLTVGSEIDNGSLSITGIVSICNTLSTNLITACNISTHSISTNYGFISSLSANNITVSKGTFSSITVTQSYISSLTVESLTVGFSTGFIYMTDIFATSLSSAFINTRTLNAVTANLSSISASIIYGKFVGDGSGLTNVAGAGGWSGTATSYLNMATYDISNAGTVNASYFKGDGSGLTNVVAGGISIVPSILSTTLLSTNLLTASNISANALSTNYGFFSTISANTIYAKFVGDGSQITGISNYWNGTATSNLDMGNYIISNVNKLDMNGNEIQKVGAVVGNNPYTLNLYGYGGISIGDTNQSGSPTASIGIDTNYPHKLLFGSGLNMNTNDICNATNIYASTYYGDGSLLTGISAGGLSVIPPYLSSILLSTNGLTAQSISSGQGLFSSLMATNSYISSLIVDSLTLGLYSGYVSMTDVLTSTISSVIVNTGSLNSLNMNTNSISNVSGSDLTINVNTTGAPVNVNLVINNKTITITADGSSGDMTITNTNSSNLNFVLGGNPAGTMTTDSSGNLYWNSYRVWTDASNIPQ